MDLTGKWIGEYTYEKGYEPEIIGQSKPFEINISDKEGNLSGDCIDDIVKAKSGNESYSNGFFKDKKIGFKKRYRYLVDYDGNEIELKEGFKYDGVDYIGRLRKKLFSRKYYFKGTWSITTDYVDENNKKGTFIVMGKWKMKRTQ